MRFRANPRSILKLEMEIIQSPHEVQKRVNHWRCEGKSIGFVPTMGALHEGHLSLARAARRDCDVVVASVFVNPTQFGTNEDLNKYPRPLERDCDLLRQCGCDLVFTPEEKDLYFQDGSGAQSWVEVEILGEVWEGTVRPGHLRGVATVVAKLFHIVRPSRAYFGEKDYQQLKVIERLARDLFFDVEIVPIETVRENDGLALSSRNAYLVSDERQAAANISRALFHGVELAKNGERDVARLRAEMQRVCGSQPLIALQYLAIVDAQTLAPLDKISDAPARILIAARVGQTRLIDNAGIN